MAGVCLFGNVVTAESKKQPDNPPQKEASVLEETKSALKKAQAILVEYGGECDHDVVAIYKSEIKALETQLQALTSVKKAKQAEKTKLNDQLQPLERKMDEFKTPEFRLKQNKGWRAYDMYVLRWRKLMFRKLEIDDTRIEIANLEKGCKEQLDELKTSLSICEDILGW